MTQDLVYELDEILQILDKEVEKSIETKTGEKPTKSLVTKEKKKLLNDPKITSEAAFLNAIAKSSISRIVKNTTEYNTILEEIKIIESNKKYYTDNQDYSDKLKTLKGILKSNLNINKKITDKEVNYIDSDIDAINDQMKNLKNSMKSMNSTALLKELKSIEDDLDDCVDFDEEYENILAKRKVIVEKISEYIDMDPEDLLEKDYDEIRFYVNQNKDKIKAINSDLKSKYDELHLKRAVEAAKKYGGGTAENIIHNNIDIFTEKGEADARELLIMSKANYVVALANKMAFSYNLKDKEDINDVIGAGMYQLTKISKDWIEYQKTVYKTSDTVLSFDTLLGINLLGEMKKMIANLRMSGMKNPSSTIGDYGNRMKVIKKFIEDNPNLKDLPFEQAELVYIESLDPKSRKNYTEKNNISVDSVSAINNTIGSSMSADDMDIFNYMSSEKNGGDEAIDNSIEVNELINILKKFFTTSKINKDGSKSDKKKYFDKVDLLILMIAFGVSDITEKIKKDTYEDARSGKRMNITDSQICEYLEKNGIKMSVGTLNWRRKNLVKNLKLIQEDYPNLKPAYDYMRSYVLSNKINIIHNTSYSEVKNALNQLYNTIS